MLISYDKQGRMAYTYTTEVPNLENEAPQNRPSPPTAQLGNGRELKFCMNSLLVNTNNNAKAIFEIPPQSQAMGVDSPFFTPGGDC